MYLQSSFPVLWYQAYNPHLLTSSPPHSSAPQPEQDPFRIIFLPFQNHFLSFSRAAFLEDLTQQNSSLRSKLSIKCNLY